MAVDLRSLRVTADMDASGYAAGARQKTAADQSMIASARQVSITLTETDQKVNGASDPLARLARQFVTGYGEAARFESGLRSLNRMLEKGKIDGEQASIVYQGMVQKLGLVANATDITRQGFGQLGAVIDTVNTKMAQLPNPAQMPLNDNFTRGRRQNLTYQLFDVGQMAALGQSPGMLALQQGPQIAQIYAAQGGVKALAADIKSMAAGAATAVMGILGPVGLLAAGLSAAAVAALSFYSASQKEAKTLDEALKNNEAAVRALGEAYGFAAQQRAKMSGSSLGIQGADLLSSASQQELQLSIARGQRELLESLTVNRGGGGSGNQFGPAITVAPEFKPFEAEINRLRVAADKGVDGIAKLREEITAKWALDPINQELTTLAGNVMDMTAALAKAADEIERLKRMRQGFVDQYRLYGMSRMAGPDAKAAQDALNGPMTFDGFLKTPNTMQAPGFRGIEDQSGSLSFYEDAIKAGERRIQQLGQEREMIGLVGAELAAAQYAQEMVNDAIAKNIQLSPDQVAALKQQAIAVGQIIDQNARLKLQHDLAFERDQLFRGPIDQAIASQLRGANQPIDLQSDEANAIRMLETLRRVKDAWEDIRDVGRDAIDSIVDSAVDGFSNIEDVVKDIGKDLLSEFLKLSISNPLKNSLYGDDLPTLDGMGGIGGFFKSLLGGGMPEGAKVSATGVMNVNAGTVVVTGGIGVGGGFNPTPTGFMDMLNGGAANDNKITRSPLAPVSSGASNAITDWLSYANQGAIRDMKLSPKLEQALASFLPDMGIRGEVFSGGQPAFGPNRTGSHRHDLGMAADMRFFKDGRMLDWANPDDQPIFEEMVRRGRGAGLTGFGAGPGYMRKGSMHVGFGSEAVWGAGGDSDNAPAWLRAAFERPLKRSSDLVEQSFKSLSNSSTQTADTLVKGLGSIDLGGGGSGGGGFFDLIGKLFGGLFGGGGGDPWAGMRGHANGTESAPPGWAWVGERGPELMKMRGGETIRDNARSMAMAGQSQRPTNINVQFHNNNQPIERVEEEDDGFGGRRMNVVFADQWSKGAATRGNPINSTLKSMGVRPRAALR